MWDEHVDLTQPPPLALGWNVLVTSRQGGQRRLRNALRRLVRLRRSGFRNVFVGQVRDIEALFVGIMELAERRSQLNEWLGKVLPIERTFALDVEAREVQLQSEVNAFVDRLVGRSFHVRVERRGHKGIIDTHALEKALGEYLYGVLEQRGERPVVQFRDPDAVAVVEIVGEVAGVALITRELRERFPFIKID